MRSTRRRPDHGEVDFLTMEFLEGALAVADEWDYSGTPQ